MSASPTFPTKNTGAVTRPCRTPEGEDSKEEHTALSPRPPPYNLGDSADVPSHLVGHSNTTGEEQATPPSMYPADNSRDVPSYPIGCATARKRKQSTHSATSPEDISGDVPAQLTGQTGGKGRQQTTPSATPPTDNTRDARYQSSVQFRLNGPYFLDVPLVPPTWTDNYQGEGAETQGEEGTTQTKDPIPPTEHSGEPAKK